MPTFIGFNTIGQDKKFTLTDFALVKRDLINAFNIQQGQLLGRPHVGTIIWSYIFENITPEIESMLQTECRRVVATDPRLMVQDIYVYPQENGILLELMVKVLPNSTVEQVSIFFDQRSRVASAV